MVLRNFKYKHNIKEAVELPKIVIDKTAFNRATELDQLAAKAKKAAAQAAKEGNAELEQSYLDLAKQLETLADTYDDVPPSSDAENESKSEQAEKAQKEQDNLDKINAAIEAAEEAKAKEENGGENETTSEEETENAPGKDEENKESEEQNDPGDVEERTRHETSDTDGPQAKSKSKSKAKPKINPFKKETGSGIGGKPSESPELDKKDIINILKKLPPEARKGAIEAMRAALKSETSPTEIDH